MQTEGSKARLPLAKRLGLFGLGVVCGIPLGALVCWLDILLGAALEGNCRHSSVERLLNILLEVWAGTVGLGILAALATAVLRNHPLAPFLRGLILATTIVALGGLFVIDVFIAVFAADC